MTRKCLLECMCNFCQFLRETSQVFIKLFLRARALKSLRDKRDNNTFPPKKFLRRELGVNIREYRDNVLSYLIAQ